MIGFFAKLKNEQSVKLIVICSKLLEIMINSFIVNTNTQSYNNAKSISLINDNNDIKFFMFNSLMEFFNRLLLIDDNAEIEVIKIIIDVIDIMTAFILREGTILYIIIYYYFYY